MAFTACGASEMVGWLPPSPFSQESVRIPLAPALDEENLLINTRDTSSYQVSCAVAATKKVLLPPHHASTHRSIAQCRSFLQTAFLPVPSMGNAGSAAYLAYFESFVAGLQLAPPLSPGKSATRPRKHDKHVVLTMAAKLGFPELDMDTACRAICQAFPHEDELKPATQRKRIKSLCQLIASSDPVLDPFKGELTWDSLGSHDRRDRLTLGVQGLFIGLHIPDDSLLTMLIHLHNLPPPEPR